MSFDKLTNRRGRPPTLAASPTHNLVEPQKLKHQQDMYAKYIKQEISDLNGTGLTQAFYKMKLKPMSFRQFTELCHREGKIDESQLLGVISLVSEKLALCMAEGYSVKLDGIGTFSAKLGVRDDRLPDAFEPGEASLNAKSIEVNGVAFKADKDLVLNTDSKCTLVRGGESRLKKSPYTLEERIQRASQYLRTHYFMKVSDYMRLTGLSRSTATRELCRLDANPEVPITSQGRKSQKIYMLSRE